MSKPTRFAERLSRDKYHHKAKQLRNWKARQKASELTPEKLKLYVVDNPGIRLDEHDRACVYCSTRFDRCPRARVLLMAIEVEKGKK